VAVVKGPLLALCLLAPSVAAAQPKDAFVGDWVGKGETLTWTDPFDMTLHIAPDGAGSLVYEGANAIYHCDVKWSLLKRTKRMLDYREKVLTGPCIDGGAVTLTPNGDGLDFNWTRRVDGETVRARGKFWRKPVLTS
jgi:hypothetical protein